MKTERAFITTEGKETLRRLESTQRFDDRGNLLESVLYDIGSAVIKSSEKPPVSKRSVFLYNAPGRIEETIYDSKNDVTLKTVYTYDPAARRVEAITQSDKSPLNVRTLYSYDGTGKLTERLSEGETPFEGRTTFSYAPDGKLIEENRYSRSGEQQNKTTYRYEANSRRIDRIDFKAKDSVEDLVVVLTDLKKKTKGVAYYRADGTVAWQLSFTYDDRDNVTGEEFANLEALNKYAYKYEFDPAGNWVKRTKLRWFVVSGKPEPEPAPVEVSYRTFSYYPSPYAQMKGGLPPLYPKDQYGAGIDRVMLGEVIEYVELPYPKTKSGPWTAPSVAVEVVVDKEGKVETAKQISGPASLREAATQAASKWRFKPALLNGFPVRATRPVSFSVTIVIQRR
ncbi:MAG TPA: TonB family protein [Blastocatellia bacterium]|nr:TonB family protein [Blastocatellia bacterium]